MKIITYAHSANVLVEKPSFFCSTSSYTPRSLTVYPWKDTLQGTNTSPWERENSSSKVPTVGNMLVLGSVPGPKRKGLSYNQAFFQGQAVKLHGCIKEDTCPAFGGHQSRCCSRLHLPFLLQPGASCLARIDDLTWGTILWGLEECFGLGKLVFFLFEIGIPIQESVNIELYPWIFRGISRVQNRWEGVPNLFARFNSWDGMYSYVFFSVSLVLVVVVRQINIVWSIYSTFAKTSCFHESLFLLHALVSLSVFPRQEDDPGAPPPPKSCVFLKWISSELEASLWKVGKFLQN